MPAPATDHESGDTELDVTVDRLRKQLPHVGRLAVALSGGVDSSVLLALCARALGKDRVVAVVGVSASLAQDDFSQAEKIAQLVGVELISLPTTEGQNPAYQANGVDRCYHCRTALFDRIDSDVAQAHGLDAVAYGEHAGDRQRPDRPGRRAASEHGVLAPLADLGLDKEDVRRLARLLDLPNAERPAAPCLASRIPHGEEVVPEKLRQIERAEAALRQLGFADLRVRHHGTTARVEFARDDVARAFSAPLAEDIARNVRACGFDEVVIDPQGLQSGEFTRLAMHPRQ